MPPLPLKTPSVFQSTLPVGGATRFFFLLLVPVLHFNPRSPWGERPFNLHKDAFVLKFQSTLPVGGATDGKIVAAADLRISIHAPRGGSDGY